ncbi:MAG TPA: hypothetical protein VGW34_15660 [Allosphingosinicella sp.]|nr:hypothetical protein [Allosphingosinicella sp.]
MDDGLAKVRPHSNPRFNNEVELVSHAGIIDDFDEMARANKLTLRFLLQEGEETIELDQTDEGLRSVLDPCISAREQQIADIAVKREQEKLAAAEQERIDTARRGEEELRLQSQREAEEKRLAEESAAAAATGNIADAYYDDTNTNIVGNGY